MTGQPIDVAGGVYTERCLAPDRHDVFGSGGRAAAVIKLLGGHSTLHTYLDSKTASAFLPIAHAHGIAVHAIDRPTPVVFGYSHPLATPDVVPPRHRIDQQRALEITSASALRFGMVEGSARLTAEKAVFDPQDPGGPSEFRTNGSTATSLALILNRREASALLGHKGDLETAELARRVADHENASVVIVKLGAFGALVHDRESGTVDAIPAFRTPRVWKIGSGDAFSGAFAYYWMNQHMSPSAAARAASLASAHYCMRGDVADLYAIEELQVAAQPSDHARGKGLVYLAGPFFTTASLWIVTEAWRFLKESGVPVFSPYHDVGRGPGPEVAPKDIEAIHSSSVMLALMDGSDPGTVFEIGYARAKGIPVVVLAESTTSEDLKMVVGSGCEVYHDLAAALYRVATLA